MKRNFPDFLMKVIQIFQINFYLQQDWKRITVGQDLKEPDYSKT